MMKSPMLSVSAVLVVVCSRPDTEAPKWLGDVPAGGLGVESTNWTPSERWVAEAGERSR